MALPNAVFVLIYLISFAIKRIFILRECAWPSKLLFFAELPKVKSIIEAWFVDQSSQLNNIFY